ncbi:hypothetical protein HY003_01640 [Candidatus Saccharibacteria bacterium]|nr:hypothetical protein [Candidatus Saccharibacteria bacterium]MBI3337978.1 hypothetical protein [Candidatus Saccharibacteria bacterium]
MHFSEANFSRVNMDGETLGGLVESVLSAATSTDSPNIEINPEDVRVLTGMLIGSPPIDGNEEIRRFDVVQAGYRQNNNIPVDGHVKRLYDIWRSLKRNINET